VRRDDGQTPDSPGSGAGGGPVRPALSSWSRAQRRLHWWTAALVSAGFVLAWIMVAVPLRDLLTKFLLYQLHKTFGLTVLALLAWRWALRARRGRPAPEAAMPRRERLAAALGQGALYALLLVVPVLGYLTACVAPGGIPTLFLAVIPIPSVTGPDPAWYAVLFQVHRWAAVALVVLAGGHALAAWRHHRRGRAVLLRMWRG
jgi:cytochrome b561